MFNRKCSLIGVVHVEPLPGSAGYRGDMEQIISRALEDGLTYFEGGVDAIMLENMHDVPYLNGYVDPETTAAMAAVAQAMKAEINLPMGVQLLAGANLEALGVAVAARLDFIRVEGFVFAHVGDEGMHDSCAAALIRRRSTLRADSIRIFADIKKKHASHAITSDVDLAETAEAAEFFRADGVIVTGSQTGVAPLADDVRVVREAIKPAVLVGSGVTAANVHEFFPWSDALIVGSAMKVDGRWNNRVEAGRVDDLVRALAAHNSVVH